MPTQSMPSTSRSQCRHVPTLVLVHAKAGRHLRLSSPTGAVSSIRSLTEVVEYLGERPDCDMGVKTAIVALGVALHCSQNCPFGVAAAFDEAVTVLRGCKASQILLRLERCIDRRDKVLTNREAAARVMAEARRIVRDCASSQAKLPGPLMRTASAVM
jgi:hypothetical protein